MARPRSVNHRATQNKFNIGTTTLERSVVYITGGLKAFHCTNFTLGPDTNSKYKKIHKKFGLHNGFLNQCISVKTQNQTDHCDKTNKEYSWLIPHCKPELKEIAS